MTIDLIKNKEYLKLLEIQKNHHLLTFQNKGYQYINKSKFSEEDKKAFEEVTEILSKSVRGFSEFNNFKLDKNKNIGIRLQYNYGYEEGERSFYGVGYLLVSELLNGFK